MQDVITPDWLARIKTLGSIVPELCQRNAIISIKLLYPHMTFILSYWGYYVGSRSDNRHRSQPSQSIYYAELYIKGCVRVWVQGLFLVHSKSFQIIQIQTHTTWTRRSKSQTALSLVYYCHLVPHHNDQMITPSCSPLEFPNWGLFGIFSCWRENQTITPATKLTYSYSNETSWISHLFGIKYPPLTPSWSKCMQCFI